MHILNKESILEIVKELNLMLLTQDGFHRWFMF